MPTFDVQAPNGTPYEVDAPDIHAATSALGAPTFDEDKYHAAARDQMAKAAAAGAPNDPYMARILHGATFGFSDELTAAATTPLAMLYHHTASPAEGYRYAKALEDMNLDQARQSTGTLGTVAELGGGVLSGTGAARAGLGVLGRLAPDAGLGAKSLASAADAGLYGTVAGAGEGNSLEERGQNALTGGLSGMLLGGVAPGALKIAGAVASPVVSNIAARLNPAKYAQGQVARAISESGQTPQSLLNSITTAAQQGQPEFTLADALGNPGQRMLSTVTRAPGDGRTEAINFLDARQAGQGRRVANTLAEGFDAPQTAQQATDRLTQARDAASDVNYDAARANAGAVNVTPVIQRIDRTLRPGAGGFINPQASIAPDSVEASLANVRARLTDGRSNLTDFESLQRVRGDLSDQIEAARRAGTNNKARLLTQVRTELDVAMEQASPGFVAANRAHAAAS